MQNKITVIFVSLYFATALGFATALHCTATVGAGSRCGSVDTASPQAIDIEVSRIFNSTLDRMESTAADGIKVSTWMGWSSSDEEQIECLGQGALPSIEKQLGSQRAFGQLLAVKMLGWVGGKEIIAPLAKVLQESKSQSVRVSALESLFHAPGSDAVPVLKFVSKSDPDKRVRTKAEEILARYDKTEASQSRLTMVKDEASMTKYSSDFPSTFTFTFKNVPFQA
ncbi:MAG TPA: HEAT repeat domain-containing protein [Candidatus Angelobacter sp.]|nr:HEAT repeat domain-containing protein [Candidatus Angelobacter sp.]